MKAINRMSIRERHHLLANKLETTRSLTAQLLVNLKDVNHSLMIDLPSVRHCSIAHFLEPILEQLTKLDSKTDLLIHAIREEAGNDAFEPKEQIKKRKG